MRALTFDMSSTSGAAFDGADGKPLFSTHKDRMPMDGDFGPMFGRKARWARDLIALQRPDRIGVEAPWIPIPRSGDDSTETAKTAGPEVVFMLCGLVAVIMTVADAHAIPCKRRVQRDRKSVV